MKKHACKDSGFTLIELLIVVTIIGILAAIAIPNYSNYQAKAKFIAGLSEISAGRTEFELKRNSGNTVAIPADAGLLAQTPNCDITVTNSTITCTLRQAPTQIDGETIVITVTESSGQWSCNSTVASKYATKTCPGV